MSVRKVTASSRRPILHRIFKPIPPEEKRAPRFGRLSSVEWRRRLLHILPGLLPLVLWFKFHRDPLSWDCRAWLGLVVAGIGVGTAVQYRRIARRGETSNPACILGYTIPVFMLLMSVPAHAEIGLTVLAILAVGDGFATLGGLLLPGPALPWNSEKSWAGFLCFNVFATPWAALIYWGEASPVVPFSAAFAIAAISVAISSVAESVASEINDNVRVGLAATVSVLLGHACFIGF